MKGLNFFERLDDGDLWDHKLTSAPSCWTLFETTI